MNCVENCMRRSELKEQRKKVHLTTGLAFTYKQKKHKLLATNSP